MLSGSSPLFVLRKWALSLPQARRSIWFHGATPEQFCAAEKLIRDIRAKAPHQQFVFTSVHSPTLAWLRARFPTDWIFPIPWGLTSIQRRFFRALQPRLIVLLESPAGLGEIVLRCAAEARIPVVVINMRHVDCPISNPLLSSRFADSALSHICVQDARTATALCERGFSPDCITVTGMLDFDFAPPTQSASPEYLRHEMHLPPQALLIIAEKITPAEETLVLHLFRQLRESRPQLVLCLEPQHHRQLRRLEAMFQAARLPGERRSRRAGQTFPAVIFFDRPGELPGIYSIATCVLAGGSFAGDNKMAQMIGPAYYGTPLVFGPHVSPDAELARLLLQQQAALQVSPEALATAIETLLTSPRLMTTLGEQMTALVRAQQGASTRTLQAIARFIPQPQDEPLVQKTWQKKTRRERFGESVIWRKLATYRMRRRIDDWQTLKRRLAYPRAILCLGNGPTSELPELLDMPHDCLMRVNWRWQARGMLTQPDVVFVGDPQVFQKISSCIFAFSNVSLEIGMLLRHLLVCGPRPLEYFTLERISTLMREHDWYARPTNGALMIVAAAALQPERLIIAGMDLFLHPDGRYPGDLQSSNEYSQVHTRAVDLEVIRQGLQEYRGELVILSEALRTSLAAMRMQAKEL
jgi:3-deoxy-D-manno-octulosonic-acid transferase